MGESRFDPDILLLEMAAGPGEKIVARNVVLISAAFFIGLVPFAKIPLGNLFAFIPIYETAIIINDLITAVILYGQFASSHSRSSCVLASGYLFTAVMAGVHMLSFPGLFSQTGLLGASSQTTAWLYMFWHGGFPFFVFFYALENRTLIKNKLPIWSQIVMAALAVFAGVCVLVAVASNADTLLPSIMSGNGYTTWTWAINGGTWILSFFALAVLFRKKVKSILDLWLMVTLCSWIFDIGLSAVFNHGRFDLGFYFGRIYGYLAASFVLGALLFENALFYTRLMAKNSALQLANSQLDAFSHSVSHDLRAPLRAIKGFNQILIEDHAKALSEDGRQLLKRISTAARTMETRIEGLLAFSLLGRREIKTTRVELNELIRALLDEMSSSYASREVQFKIASLGAIVGDAGLIKQVFENLLSNAIKYTRGKTPAVIEVGVVSERAAMATFFVKDNGTGFDMKYAERLFQVFQRFHSAEEFEGSGVGLSIVKNIVEKHGGSVSADSSPGAGTTIQVTLKR